MVEHSASVIVKAPVHQVYELFTHFNDFPKFMSFVKEVTYYDAQRSHWVIKALGEYEWDAVNEDWIPDQQIGWRSTRGLRNSGKVKFFALGPERTSVNVYIQYSPPSGPLGSVGERLGVNAYFDAILQKDLNHFARMVEEAPRGALDPMSSHYLFHEESAAKRGEITQRQREAMQRDPMMSEQALAEREERIAREIEQRQQQEALQAQERQHKHQEEERIRQEHEEIHRRVAEIMHREQIDREEAIRRAESIPLDPRIAYAVRAHGLGDRDGVPRDPDYAKDPMTARRPLKMPPVPPVTEQTSNQPPALG
jgi:hypothetical protein